MRLDDGHSTRVSFAADTSVLFWEKTVTPVGVSGGGANDTTTMHNTTYRTKAPKKLKTLSDGSLTVAYDPGVYPEIVALINVNTLITMTFSDGSTLAFWGWLDEFTPGEIVEGEQPEAEIVFIASNQNASLVETAPVYTPAP